VVTFGPSPLAGLPPPLGAVLADDGGLLLCVAEALADADAFWLLFGDAVFVALPAFWLPQLAPGVAVFFCVPEAAVLVPELEPEVAGAVVLALAVTLGLALAVAVPLSVVLGLVPLLEVAGLVGGVTLGVAEDGVLDGLDLVDLAAGAEVDWHDEAGAGLVYPEDALAARGPPPPCD
jgi:hypothetical protein